MTTAAPDIVEAAAALDALIRAHADETERERRVAAPVFEALKQAGIFGLCVPKALGGLEADVTTQLRTLETLSTSDGSTGWVSMIAGGSGIAAGQLEEPFAREVFGDGQVCVGVIAPMGRADPVEGGYRCSGRWQFGSGCQHADWLVNGCLVFDGDNPRMLGEGIPDWRLMFFPAADVQIIDTWNVSGLRGTGSHDLTVKDAFVPEGRHVSLITGAPSRSRPLYAFPPIGLLAAQVASVALGIARRAIDEISALAMTKTPMGSASKLGERAMTHHEVGEAEASLRSGRAFLYETAQAVWETVASGREATNEQRALLRLAAAHSTNCAVRSVDIAYALGGGSSIYASNALQRQFRDIHAVTQHITVNKSNYESMGRVLLGFPPQGLL